MNGNFRQGFEKTAGVKEVLKSVGSAVKSGYGKLKEKLTPEPVKFTLDREALYKKLKKAGIKIKKVKSDAPNEYGKRPSDLIQ